MCYSLRTMTTPDNQSQGIFDRMTRFARTLNEQLLPQPGQPIPSQKTTLEEDLQRMGPLGGPRRPIGEYVTDFATAVEEIRNNHWPFLRP